MAPGRIFRRSITCIDVKDSQKNLGSSFFAVQSLVFDEYGQVGREPVGQQIKQFTDISSVENA